MFNEWYARDISRKVTKAMRTRFENGAHYAAHAPLGYRKDPEQVGHLLVDDETKWIVEKIYALAVQGAGASKITHILAAEQIPTPPWLNFQRYGTFARIHEGQAEEKRYAWSICQVQSILRDETYIGNSVHNKRANVSFKCKKLIHRPKEEWFTVENTHEAIISKADFDRVGCCSKISRFKASRFSVRRAATIRFLPRPAKAFAVSLPIPELAPVMTVYFFVVSI